jgi:methionyl aminopeptidase
MRTAGRVVAEILAACEAAGVAGATTASLEAAAAEVLARRGAAPSFLGYPGEHGCFPSVVSTSVNDEVVHGVPGPRVLAEGDVVSIDAGAVVNGWHADAAITFVVGDADPTTSSLIAAAQAALCSGIAEVRPGRRVGDISAAIAATAAEYGFAVVKDYGGHGIGKSLHEAPAVPNWGRAGTGTRLRPGMCLAIEPIVVAGSPELGVRADGWTVVTLDGRSAAHFEHTVAVTADGVDVLTAST